MGDGAGGGGSAGAGAGSGFGHKVRAPTVPVCIDRPGLVGAAAGVQVAVLVAPAGHGKTCLAAQVGAATGGPTAWFTADDLDQDALGVVVQLVAALGGAWPDLAGPSPTLADDAAALPMLAATLDTLAGRGCIVLDNAHLMGPDLLDAVVGVALATLPAACHLVVCTRGELTASCLRAEAAGRAVVLGPSDLAFTVDECAVVSGLPLAEAHDVQARTGGWPLAVALSARPPESAFSPLPGPPGRAGGFGRGGDTGPARLDALAEVALADLSAPARSLLTVLARLPRFPATLLRGHPVDAHPELVERLADPHDPSPLAEGWLAPRVWLRDALIGRAVDVDLAAQVARELADAGEAELAAHLLLAVGRADAAVPLVEQVAGVAAREGRWARARALVGQVPTGARSLELELLAARAAGVLGDADDPVLADIVERARHTDGARLLLRAQSTLADHYRMAGDLRFVEVCEAALGDVLIADDPAEQVLRGWPSLRVTDDDAAAAAEVLRLYGLALLFSTDRPTVDRGRRLVTASFTVAGRVGRGVASQQAWFLYVEALVYLRPAWEVVPRIVASIRRLQETGHGDASVRLAELAVLQYGMGDHAGARRSVEIGTEWSDRTGYRIARPPLQAVEVALDTAEHGLSAERAARFDDTLVDMAAQARLAFYVPAYAAEFGILLVRRGALDGARRYLEQAEASLASNPIAHLSSLRCRRLRGLLHVAEGRKDEGRSALDALRRDALTEGRGALVAVLDADMAEPLQERRRDPGETTSPRSTPPAVVVRLLGPQLTAAVDGEPVPSLRGYPAKLLALLVASRGLMTMDAAIEGLWPDADPDAGRNRLHGILLRLRRSLGLTATGPITCSDGVVRLDGGGTVVVDSWAFEQAAGSVTGAGAGSGGWAALRLYGDDVLSHQFTYDDTIEAYRREMRVAYLRVAGAVLAERPERGDPADVVALAERVARLAPEDESLCLLAVRALLTHSRRSEARALVQRTENTLVDLGLDATTFTGAARAALGAVLRPDRG